MTVTAIGDAGPLAYQWRKNGTNINGATDAVLTIVNPQLTDSGNYSVVVTNILDVKTSAVAVVTITPLIEITTQPTNQPNRERRQQRNLLRGSNRQRRPHLSMEKRWNLNTGRDRGHIYD